AFLNNAHSGVGNILQHIRPEMSHSGTYWTLFLHASQVKLEDMLHSTTLSPARFPHRPLSMLHATRTEFRKLSTSVLSLALSRDSVCAADNTKDEAFPVSTAPRWRLPTFEDTSCAPWAACCTLRATSCVVAPC